MMTIESILTRRFDITFIDARSLSTEAKLNLDITCYPSKEQQLRLIEEACKIFEARTDFSKELCQSRRMSLETVKSSSGSSATCSSCSDTSQALLSYDAPMEDSGRSTITRSRRFHRKLSTDLRNVILASKKARREQS